MQLTSKPRAMIFDLDGTLANTLPQLRKAMIEVSKELGAKEPSPEEMKHYVGNGLNMLIARVLKESHDAKVEDIEQDKMERAREIFKESYGRFLHADYEIYQGVVEGINAFKKANIKLAVVTNKPHRFAVKLIEYMGLSSSFEIVLGSEVLKNRKPHPEALYYVLENMGVEAKDAVMVGDSVNDIEAGHNAGMPTVTFTYGFDGGVDLKTCNSDYLFDSFEELTKLIASLS